MKRYTIGLRPCAAIRRPCLACGDETSKEPGCASVYVAEKVDGIADYPTDDTGYVICRRCLCLSSVEVAEKARQQAIEAHAQADEIAAFAACVPEMPTPARFDRFISSLTARNRDEL